MARPSAKKWAERERRWAEVQPTIREMLRDIRRDEQLGAIGIGKGIESPDTRTSATNNQQN